MLVFNIMKKNKFVLIFGVFILMVILASLFSVKGVSADSGIMLAQKNSSGISGGGLLGPSSSSCPANPKSLGDFVSYIMCMINRAILPLLITGCVVFFVYGIFKFFFMNPADEKKRAEGAQFMIWGVIAITVIFTLWGFVGFIKRTFFGNSPIAVPQLETFN